MTQRIPLAQHRPLSPSFPTAMRSFPVKQFFGFNEAARTVDPNNPADARAVGRDTNIVIRQIAATPTPAPSTTQPPAPTQPATPTSAVPTPSTPPSATPSPTESTVHSPKRSELAKTGFGSEVLIAATLVATAGAATFTARKRHA